YTSASISLYCLFNVTSPTGYSTLSLHDALPIWLGNALAARALLWLGLLLAALAMSGPLAGPLAVTPDVGLALLLLVLAMAPSGLDRKSTRLNSSHRTISYAVFCLKKKSSCYDIN